MKNFLIIVGVLMLGMGIGWLINEHRTQQNRPCVEEEARIRQEFTGHADAVRVEFPGSEMAQKIVRARMYYELSELGCPENQQEYAGKSISINREINRELGGSPIARVGTEIRVDMQQVADTVTEVTREAVAIIGDVVDRLRDTRISITVE
jgi:hypothetical protein